MNVIITDTGDTIGFEQDLKSNILDDMKLFISEENWEMVSSLSDILSALKAWEGNPNLLIISDNNGMGCTVKEYIKSVEESLVCNTTTEN